DPAPRAARREENQRLEKGRLILRLLLAAALLAPLVSLAQPDLTSTVARVLPTVVQISTVRAPKPPSKPEAFSDSEFSEFFRRFGSSGTSAGPRVSGSGIVIGAEGYVLTAAHLFDPGDSVTVRLADGRTLAADIVGRDRRSGVALLKVAAAPGLTPAVP